MSSANPFANQYEDLRSRGSFELATIKVTLIYINNLQRAKKILSSLHTKLTYVCLIIDVAYKLRGRNVGQYIGAHAVLMS